MEIKRKINKKMRMRFAFGAMALFVCVAIVCVILIAREKPKNDQSGQSTTSTEIATQLVSATLTKSGSMSVATTTQTTTGGLYTNREFGFSLDFSEEWNGYTVSEGDHKDLAGFVESLEFKLPDISSVPLTIYVFDKQSDESILTQIHATFISRSSKYLYGYSTWENSPSGSVQITDKSIANLIATFQLM